MKVLGIDPGLRNMGWGVIEVDGPRIRHVANGVIHSDGGQDLGARLSVLFRGLCAVIITHSPDEAAVEQTFVNKDATGTLKLGQGPAGAGRGGDRGWGICAQRGQEDRCRRRPCGQGTGAAHGPRAAAGRAF